MGWLKGQFIDIIEWLDDGTDTLVHRFERHNREIKNGAKLIVKPGQAAVFVNEGKLADVFEQSDTYTLSTKNLPVLSTLFGWKYGFESPFKAEVYFVKTTRITGRKWGTKGKINVKDADFGFASVGAFGSYDFRVKQPGKFLATVVGTDGNFTMEGITDQIRDIVASRATSAIAKSGVPVMQMDAEKDEFAKVLAKIIAPEMEEYGLELMKLLIMDVSLPAAVEEAIQRRMSLGALGGMQAYQQLQAADAMRDAAKNPGLGGAGMAMGAGFAMGHQMVGAMGPAMAPPPPPVAAQFFAVVGGQQAGPYSPQQIQQFAQSGQISRDTLVWKQGMAQWIAAGQVAELSGAFGSVPPPLPPVPPPPPPSGA